MYNLQKSNNNQKHSKIIIPTGEINLPPRRWFETDHQSHQSFTRLCGERDRGAKGERSGHIRRVRREIDLPSCLYEFSQVMSDPSLGTTDSRRAGVPQEPTRPQVLSPSMETRPQN